MRRVFFFLFMSVSLSAFCQKKDSVIFDFNKPQELIPAITPAGNNGQQIVLNNEVFSNEERSIFLSFSRRSGSNGVFLTTASEISSYLFIGRGASMVITAVDVDIDSLVFSRTSKVGSLTLQEPQGIGRIDHSNESWYDSLSTSKVSKLVYENVGFDPAIQYFTVYYNSPTDILEPNSVYPSNTDIVSSFNQFTMTFDRKVKIGSNNEATLYGPIGFSNVKLTLTKSPTDENTIIASLKPGTSVINLISDEYKIVIPQGAIISDDEDEFYNKELVYHFSVVEAHDTFADISIFPEKGDVEEIPSNIILEFPSLLRYSTEKIYLTNTHTGEVIRELEASYLSAEEYTDAAPYFKADKDIYCFLKLTFTGDFVAPVTASGIYEFTIPEGFVGNTKYKPYEKNYRDEGIEYNPEITIKYNVNGVEIPSPAKLNEAKELLALQGAGYPASDSPARIALQDLVNSGIGSNEVFDETINSFYEETQVEMPTEGYYLLSAVPYQGNPIYLTYLDGAISLSTDEDEAVHLQARLNDDGTLSMITPDGKYLSLMVPHNNNVTDTYNKQKNNLTFTHLSLGGKCAKDVFGLWSIYGWVKHTEQGEITAFARVNTQEMAFSTDRDEPLKYFDSEQTNAFLLSVTGAPAPNVLYKLTPDKGDTLKTERIEIAFSNIEKVNVVDSLARKIVIAGTKVDRYGQLITYSPDFVRAVNGTTNRFIISFEHLPQDKYDLRIPKGTFNWTFDTRKYDIEKIEASYVVKDKVINNTKRDGVGFQYDYITRNQIYYYDKDFLNTYYRDVDLNNLIIYMYKDATWGVTDKKVIVQNVYTTNDSINGFGHFEILDNFEIEGANEISGIRLVMDSPITLGSLRPGLYEWRIPAGTFGNEGYAKWLQDPYSTSKTEMDCRVNFEMYPNIMIDNDKANIQFVPKSTSFVGSLSEIILTFPYYNNVNIVGNNNLIARNSFYGDEIDGTLEPVNSNTFRFISTERLKRYGSFEGQYIINIPQNMFSCSNDAEEEILIPEYGSMEVIFYGRNDGDDINNISYEAKKDVIYDIAGRQVNNMSKPGIYIVGGRKVVVK